MHPSQPSAVRKGARAEALGNQCGRLCPHCSGGEGVQSKDPQALAHGNLPAWPESVPWASGSMSSSHHAEHDLKFKNNLSVTWSLTALNCFIWGESEEILTNSTQEAKQDFCFAIQQNNTVLYSYTGLLKAGELVFNVAAS